MERQSDRQASVIASAAAAGRMLLQVQARSEKSTHRRLDPALDLLVELAYLAAGRADRRSDDHAHRARLLQQAAPRPVAPGVVRDRHDEPVGPGREQRAAHAVTARLADRHARTDRKSTRLN